MERSYIKQSHLLVSLAPTVFPDLFEMLYSKASVTFKVFLLSSRVILSG